MGVWGRSEEGPGGVRRGGACERVESSRVGSRIVP